MVYADFWAWFSGNIVADGKDEVGWSCGYTFYFDCFSVDLNVIKHRPYALLNCKCIDWTAMCHRCRPPMTGGNLIYVLQWPSASICLLSNVLRDTKPCRTSRKSRLTGNTGLRRSLRTDRSARRAKSGGIAGRTRTNRSAKCTRSSMIARRTRFHRAARWAEDPAGPQGEQGPAGPHKEHRGLLVLYGHHYG